eukprot:TRINITY_DN9044_c0_g1_i1.p1 TRINITY_DN9044_c0_g1~~TRINITY_DN9044_c0_g1_i1.p1  ORF type:complete len:455 (+),score=146.01 TRINITY_DN9044_c0_g1_i1:130-1494(+)
MKGILLTRLAAALLLFDFCQLSIGINVSVMMPLDLVSNSGQLNSPSQVLLQLQQLKSGGVDGIMTDVWWGIVERSGPKQYNFSAYVQLAQLVQQAGLQMQCVMSFHQCGTNVGDACYVPLPPWVIAVGNQNPAIWYTDSQGGIDQEYISLGADNQTLFYGRTPLQMYADYMAAFASAMGPYMGSVINQVQVGLGPSGELRYPSYQLQDNKWAYCGIGEFQCYDAFMLKDLAISASAINHPEWGHGGPDNAGTYNSQPSQTGFFSDNGGDNYASPYGQFFIGWYSQRLITHGQNILTSAVSIFRPLGVSVAAKVSGIHWWYNTDSHAAEVTAGYFNTDNNDAYLQLARMFATVGVAFDFTALEMTDSQNSCGSAPQELVKQTILAAHNAGIEYAGENALPICSPCYQGGFDEIYTESTQYGAIGQFTFLRLDSSLLQGSNWQMFTAFVAHRHAAR